MDKEKMEKWISLNERKIDGAIYSFKLLQAIKDGEFNKEPCDMCGYWENIINNGHNDDIKYCTQCGRKLEDTNHDN